MYFIKAQSATLTIAQAFNLAFEEWMRDKNRKKKREDGDTRKGKIGGKNKEMEKRSEDVKMEGRLAENKEEDLLIDLASLSDNNCDEPKLLITDVDSCGEKESEDRDLSFTQ